MKYILFSFALALFACSDKPSHQHNPAKIDRMSAVDSLLRDSLPSEIDAENHSIIMDMILGKPKQSIKSIGILVYDGVNDLDFTGPRYVFGQTGAKVLLIATKPGHIKTAMGVEVVPNTVIDSVQHLDILVIPGGARGTVLTSYNETVLDWIRNIDKQTIYTTSVCTGGWILGSAGLLKGKKASTNWYREEEFLKKYGATPANERFTHDGKYWTSAGVTAGMDMSIAIVRDNWGDKFAQGVMLDMEYDPAPPIEGGSPEKTNWLVEWMMKSMYDAGINPIIDSLENEKPK
jgi:transcriptional regulator GlxA family with amidase domain